MGNANSLVQEVTRNASNIIDLLGINQYFLLIREKIKRISVDQGDARFSENTHLRNTKNTAGKIRKIKLKEILDTISRFKKM